MGCTLWNKKREIDIFLLKNTEASDLYSIYSNEFMNKKKVSKLYFNQYLQSLKYVEQEYKC